MQVNTSKYILLVTLFLIVSIGLSAQIGRKKYITRSGDTTIIVSDGNSGLRGEDARFLLDGRASEDLLNKYSKYGKLKEAADETNQVANIVDVEKKETNPSSGSLGFRTAQKNMRYLQKDKQSDRLSRQKIHRDLSLDELTYMKEKFGEKPSYFVNGIQVDPQTAAGIAEKDILIRSLKVSNTTTGNPNGEVWYVVNTKAYNKLGLDDYEMLDANDYATTNSPRNKNVESPFVDESIFDEDVVTMPSSITNKEYQRLSPSQQQTLSAQQLELEELKRQIEEVRMQRAAISGGSVTNYPQQPRSYQPTPSRSNRVTQSEEIVGFKDSPQERTRRERDQMSETGITDDTPKRSVRRIKDRERNR